MFSPKVSIVCEFGGNEDFMVKMKNDGTDPVSAPELRLQSILYTLIFLSPRYNLIFTSVRPRR